MLLRSKLDLGILILLSVIIIGCEPQQSEQKWTINEEDYLETQGLSILVFHNFYPGGKQGGVEIIQHGERIATNGFIRLQRVEGQRFSYPERANRIVNQENQQIKAIVNYEDLDFSYTIRIWPEDEEIRLAVDLDKPIPAEWEDKLSFALEFFPPLYYGKSFQIGESIGIIPRQANGPKIENEDGNLEPSSMGRGKIITLAGEDPYRQVTIENMKGELILLDERNTTTRGWIWVKSTIPVGVTDNAVEWKIKPNVVPGWTRDPMIAVSQVGYHPNQAKQAIIELEPATEQLTTARLLKVTGEKDLEEVISDIPEKWGKFLCYNYAVFDFSSITKTGMYVVNYGTQFSNPFQISKEVFKKNVWQPTLEGFFPVQMCHVKVRERSAIWHGACHLDDALQAPLAIEHIDGYRQYEEAETRYSSLTPVPFLNQGGWHDAGDDDLAAGSQASTTHYLVLSDEICEDQPDQTYVNFEDRMVQMGQPDGIPDFLQQIKHGALNLLSGYRVAGHSFAGIIATREGRNIEGDWASQTDQLFYDSKLGPKQKTLTHSGVPDDRWVFTNKDTGLEYQVVAALSAASRSLQDFDDELADECLETAIKAWNYEQLHDPISKPNAYVPRNAKLYEILATVELLYTTREDKYASHLVSLWPAIQENIERAAWGVTRVLELINDDEFNTGYIEALHSYSAELDSTLATNPFGVPWRPRIWGIGWDIQRFALEHYYLVRKYPDLFNQELIFRVVNYVLGCHPGSNTSLVSGVGSHSITSAFGVNRNMWYYIPGGMVSGTALVRPDFPELKENFPYLWQQTEYVMPGAGSYIFCVLAADMLLND
ncbi:glycoside hydrolase family 9 protein [Bacteroidota bacterium]